jgi:hypothetical protein
VQRGQRLALILAAAAVAAVAFVVLRPSDDDEPTRGSPPEPTATARAPRPAPRFETIRIAGGEVRGGKRTIAVSKGEVARIEVRSDTRDQIHLHGFDLYRDVAPGKPARFKVEANIDGAFELEAHDLGHVVIGTLVVEP